MRIGKYWLLTVLLFGCLSGIRAQRADSVRWAGQAQLRGAADFGHASDLSLSMGVRRETPRLSVSLDLSGNRTRSLRAKEVTYSSENIKYGHKENARSESRASGENLRIGLRYVPRSSDVFRLDFSQSYTRSDRCDTLYSQKIGAEGGQAVLLAEGSSFEAADRLQQTYRCDASYAHRIDASRHSFHAELSFRDNVSSQTDIRMLAGSLYTPQTYRIAPDYENRTSRLNMYYRDAAFLDIASLDFFAGLDLQWGMSNDRYAGATLVDGAWRDSLLLKQKYLYRQATAEPYAAATYHYRIFDFSLEERFQYYNHRLWSNLNGWDWDQSDLFHAARAAVKCTPSERHRLQLDMERSLSRPNYLMLSGLLRSGSSPDVYYIGNAGLQPTKIYRLDLQYQSDVRQWRYGIQMGYRLMQNVAEQVLFTGQEKLPVHLRETLENAVVYSWLNTAYKENYHLKLSVRWKGGDCEVNAWSVLNCDANRYASSSATDFNCTLGCDASWRFRENWKLSLRNSFDSRRREVYTHTSAYLSSALRVDYEWKKLLCYAAIDELFDRPIERTTFSENFDYRRTERTRYYRRLLALGVQCRF